MDQPCMVANPARSQLNRKMNISLSPFAPEIEKITLLVLRLFLVEILRYSTLSSADDFARIILADSYIMWIIDSRKKI